MTKDIEEKKHLTEPCPTATLLTYNREEILRECVALITYICRHGDVLPDKDDANHKEHVNLAYETLIDGVMKCNDPAASADDWKSLITAYTQVTRFTYKQSGVNGRSVLDTLDGKNQFFNDQTSWWYRYSWLLSLLKRQNRPLLYGLVLLLLAFYLQSPMGVSDNGIHDSLKNFYSLLTPMLWGAIGSCAFLMKCISDKLSELAYERSRQQGIGARVLLGAILAFIAVQIIPSGDQNISNEQADPFGIGTIALAFMVGLSIKPVYAALEELLRGITDRIRGKHGSSPEKES